MGLWLGLGFENMKKSKKRQPSSLQRPLLLRHKRYIRLKSELKMSKPHPSLPKQDLAAYVLTERARRRHTTTEKED